MKNPSASELKQPPSRDAAIEAAALRLFVRHGFEKVRIGEIAAACGMSRPTLYAAFENKEAILSSIVRRHTRDLLASTTTALAGKPSLRAKLDYLFAAWIIDPYAIVIDADHASDLSTSAPKFAPQATAEMWDAIEQQVAGVLREGSKPKHGPAISELAHVLVTAVNGAKPATAGIAELRRVVRGLVLMALARLDAITA